jgi:hypothetical protein
MRLSLVAALALSAVVVSACADGITGPGPKAPVSLDFCEGTTPIWFAIQNETEEWEEISGDAAGTFTFDATPQVSIALVVDDGFDFSTEVFNVTRDELDPLSGVTCAEGTGTKSLSGAVAGLTGQQVGRLSMALETDGVNTGNTSYSFAGLPTGPLDLVATRFATAGTQPPDRIIVRRNLDLQNGTNMPVLDFGSTEAQPLTTATVTFGNRGSDFVDVTTEYLSANGTVHQLMHFSSVDAGASAFVSVPEAMRGADDLHLMSAFASAAAGTREVSRFYRNPGNVTLTFGPMLGAATTSYLSGPYVRPRLTVASQAEYASAMEAFFGQLSGASFRTVTIFTSSAFLGARPLNWELEMPDLSAAGYESVWAFPTSAQVNSNAHGFDGDVSVILGAAPSDGDVIRSSIRASSDVVALQVLRSGETPHRAWPRRWLARGGAVAR